MRLFVCITYLLTFLSCRTGIKTELTPKLIISENKRFLATKSGDPFFWLGDTGWMLFTRLSREEADSYFRDRKEKGFNVPYQLLRIWLWILTYRGSISLYEFSHGMNSCHPGERILKFLLSASRREALRNHPGASFGSLT